MAELSRSVTVKPQIEGFDGFEHSDGRYSHWVYTTGQGPPLILLHELPQIDAAFVATARRIAAEGFSLFMPSLLSEPLKPLNGAERLTVMAGICVSAEFNALFSMKRAPVTDWIQSLITEALNRTPGHDRAGLLGLCFTGGFALAGAIHPAVTGAVACEPALPGLDRNKIGIHETDVGILKQRIADKALNLRVFRFSGDKISPCERMQGLARTFGDGIDGRCLPDSAGARGPGLPRPHSVITHHLIDAPGEPTRQVLDYIIAYFHWRLKDPDGPAPPLDVSQPLDCLKGGCQKTALAASQPTEL